jgi:hypothetical protein
MKSPSTRILRAFSSFSIFGAGGAAGAALLWVRFTRLLREGVLALDSLFYEPPKRNCRIDFALDTLLRIEA